MSITQKLEKNTAVIFILILIIGGFGLYAYDNLNKDDDKKNDKPAISTQVNNFKECDQRNGVVIDNSPRICKWKGETYTEEAPEKIAIKETDLKINNLDTLLQGPLNLTGNVDGSWFNEGDFPVILLDEDGNKILETYARAQGDWMGKKEVSFKLEANYSKENVKTKKGLLVFKKANPSGLKKNSKKVEIPVQFAHNVDKIYTNSYYPELKMSYTADWKFETKLGQTVSSKDGTKLYSRTIKLFKGDNSIIISLTPLAGPVGWGGGELYLQGNPTSSDFYRYLKDGKYYFIDQPKVIAGIMESVPSVPLIKTTLKNSEFYIMEGYDGETLKAMVNVTYKGDKALLPEVEEILKKSNFK